MADIVEKIDRFCGKVMTNESSVHSSSIKNIIEAIKKHLDNKELMQIVYDNLADKMDGTQITSLYKTVVNKMTSVAKEYIDDVLPQIKAKE